ncbi:MAG: hypothetical protein PVSMB3_14580 [Candidatus Dormibacteraceae bacterium]
MKSIRILVFTAVLFSACSMWGSGPVQSPIPIESMSPSPTPANSKAVNLRTTVDLLLGEHVMVIAKQATAAANKTDGHAAYATLLIANTNSLVDVIRSAYGNAAASQFEKSWGIQNGYLVDYTIGLVSHNEAKSNGAKSALATGFVPEFAKLITGFTQIPVDQMTQLETRQVTALQLVIEDAAAQSYPKIYVDLRAAYAITSSIGDMLAARTAQQFPDKFPGDPSSKAADTRVSLNVLLQEHSYLATMTTDAASANRINEQSAAAAALGANADALGQLFVVMSGAGAGTQVAQLWGARNSDLISYAINGDAAARLGLTEKFVTKFYGLAPNAADALRDQAVMTIKVIDDQRAKNFKLVAGDDRAAAAAMQAVADHIA